MHYLVSAPDEPTAWTQGIDAFLSCLGQRFPEAQVWKIDDPQRANALEWETETARGKLFGALSQGGEVLALEGDVEDCAEVALWFRSLVPADRPLLFYDEDFQADVILTEQLSVADVTRPFS